MNKRVLLISPSPYFNLKNSDGVGIQGTLPQLIKNENMSIRYLSASLKDKGFECDIIDCQLEGKSDQDILEKIEDSEYLFIGISLSVQTIFKDIISLIVKIKTRYSGKIVVGGQFASIEYLNILKNYHAIDIVVIGEGEETICSLANNLSLGKDISNLKGVAQRDFEGNVHSNGSNWIDNLDSLAYPDRTGIEHVIRAKQRITIISKRGCYGKCSYCSNISYYGEKKNLRFRSPENVFNEVSEIYREHKWNRFVFHDEIFVDKSIRGMKWLKEFHALIKQEDLVLDLWVKLRANDCDDDLLKLLFEIGVKTIFLGVEAGNDNSLKRFKKMSTASDNTQAVNTCLKYGFKVNIGYIMFEPYMSFSDLIKNYEWISQYSFSEPQNFYSYLLPFNGTLVEKQLLKDNLLQKNEWFEMGTYNFADSKVSFVYDILSKYKNKISETEYYVNVARVLLFDMEKKYDLVKARTLLNNAISDFSLNVNLLFANILVEVNDSSDFPSWISDKCRDFRYENYSINTENIKSVCESIIDECLLLKNNDISA